MSKISKEDAAWYEKMARLEGSQEISAGMKHPDYLATLNADAPAISDDHKAEAREIVGLSDNSKSSWRHGYAKKIAAALAAAEARGKAEGRSEEISLLNYIRSALPVLQTMTTRIGLPKGAKQAGEMLEAIDARLSSLSAQQGRGE